MGHPVEMVSRVGHGSVFRVLVDAGDANALENAVSAVPPTPGSMDGHCVVVIDDEPSVRESTRKLLTSWGCNVIAAGDCAEAIAALESRMPSALIVDYRLREGQDGLGAIARMRAALHRDIPAVLVSGESSAEELMRIKASGFLLLNKPVPPARLRSALAFLLNSEPGTRPASVE
jgi:two-component system, sensor histidine kinase